MTLWKNDIAKITIPTPFPVGDVNAFVIKGDALTLVDAGPKTEETHQAIQAGLKDLRLDMKDIDQIIITHHHPDHVGGVDFFEEGTPILGHENNKFWLNPDEAIFHYYEGFYLDLAKELGIPSEFHKYVGTMKSGLKYSCNRSLDISIKEGDTVPGLNDWVVYETPGHAESHISLYRESDGAFIGGDLLLQKVSPNPLIEPPMKEGDDRPKSQLLLNHSLNRLLEMPIQTVFAGHGDEIHQPNDLIHKRLAAQHERAMKVRELLKQEPATVLQICMKLFPGIYQKQIGLTLSETLAQFDYLLDLDEIRGEETKNGIVYSVK
ncbi:MULTISPECIES: MBL fold metallo-hydrolase [Bacillus]|uniref:MBL fold metallo-hydrolase n=1 Tax=Bacillus TaxID=1386 RepID=UPI000305534B|nr:MULTISPECIES: MBL fold metallo-hydrolase [Bacillus]